MKVEELHTRLINMMISYFERAIDEHSKSDYRFTNSTRVAYLETFHLGPGSELEKLFQELYEESMDKKYYWYFCSSEVYKETFQDRRKEYLSKFPSALEREFIDEELVELELSKANGLAWLDPSFKRFRRYFKDYQFVLPFLTDDFKKNLAFDQKRKIEFLRSQEESDNPYPTIFRDKESFDFFKYLLEKVKSSNAELSYIFRYLTELDLESPRIVCTAKEYIDFVDHLYRVRITKLKTSTEVGSDKRKNLYRSLEKEFRVKSPQKDH